MRPSNVFIISSSPRYVPSPIEVRSVRPGWESRQRRATVRWLAVAGVCFAVAAGMVVAWGLS